MSGSKDKSLRLSALAGHLLAEGQQCSLAGLCVNGRAACVLIQVIT